MYSILLQGFRVGPWRVEPLSGTIIGPDGEVRHLEPKVMDVFVCLAEHANELVSRDRLLRAAWGERAVSDEPLTRVISQLRKAMRSDRADAAFIQTVPKRGYRLVGDVRLADGSPLPSAGAGNGYGAALTDGRRIEQFGDAVIILGIVDRTALPKDLRTDLAIPYDRLLELQRHGGLPPPPD